MKVFIGLIIPFLGTMLGSSMVFLMKDKLNQKLGSILSGFAGGVMVAASIWSLMDPSIKMAEEQSVVAWIPAAVGFALGTGFLLLLDNIVPHLHYKGDRKSVV